MTGPFSHWEKGKVYKCDQTERFLYVYHPKTVPGRHALHLLTKPLISFSIIFAASIPGFQDYVLLMVIMHESWETPCDFTLNG